MTTLRFALLAGLVAGSQAMGTSIAAQSDLRYTVTVTNLTKGQSFTPLLLTTHVNGLRIFSPGTAASPQLRTLAEEGETGPLAALLRQSPIDVRDVVTGSALLPPAVTISFEIAASDRANRFSLAAMLIPTNDAFVGLANVQLPTDFDPVVLDAPAYDAGTEQNDERCASIPGPSFSECRGPGGGAQIGGGEGAITIHNGINGIGDMNRPLRDWRNPVARITIQRTR